MNKLVVCGCLPCEGQRGAAPLPHREAALQELELTEVLLEGTAAHEVTRHVGSRLKHNMRLYLFEIQDFL